MRNLKRALSLGLASAMTLGTVAFSASAVTFHDQDKVTNEKAVSIVHQIGLMIGDDEGYFNPDEPVTRAEMAVICTTMLNGANFHVSQFVEIDAFSDVPAWASDYVNLAASLGIVDGRGDGIFDPSATVTTAEAMLMLLKTLGYFQNSNEFGDNWKLATTRKGTELNLYNQDEDGVLSADEPLVRENVASLAFRALTDVVQVQYNPTFQEYYNQGASMTHGVDNTVYTDSLGYKNFKYLHSNDTTDVFGRPTVTWVYNGQEIGEYLTDANYEFTTSKTVKEMYTLIGSNMLENENYNRAIYIDGEVLDGSFVTDDLEEDGVTRVKLTSDSTTVDGIKELINNTDTTTFLESGNGVLTQVYMIAPEYNSAGSLITKGELIVSMIHTYLAEVTYCTENGEDYQVGISFQSKAYQDVTQQAIVEDNFEKVFDSSVEYEKGTMLAVNMASDNSGKWTVVEEEVYVADLVNGTATGSRLEPEVVGGSWLAVDGEQFDYALSVRGNISDSKVMVPTSQTEIEVYLDKYGFVLGYDAVVPGSQYLYVEAKDQSAVMGGSRARVTFSDGTEEFITISYIDNVAVSSSNWSIIPDTNRYEDTVNNKTYSANENFVAGTEGQADEQLENRIFGYTLLSDGSYKLTTTIRGQYDGDENTKGVLPGIEVDGNTFVYNSTDDYSSTQDGIHDILNTTLIHTPEKDTMFIYSSKNYGEEIDTDTVASDLEEQNATSSAYNFAIKTDHTRVTYGTGTDSEKEHAFVVDYSTVFVDVVGNNTWTLSTVPNMNSSDLNMQVVFGEDGIADVVFINNGAPQNSGGDWFIVLDNQAEWALVDGVDTYTYKVWINGVEETIVSKDGQLFDQNNEDGLNNNDLYRIVNEDEDYVYSVDRYYQLDWYANVSPTSVASTAKYPMGGVEIVGDGVIIFEENTKEYYEDYDKNTNGKTWFDAVEKSADPAAAMDAIDTDKDGSQEADGFTYNDNTKFIVLTSKGTTSFNNSEKYSIHLGSADDIRTINDSGIPSWVDVVEADNDSGSSHPVAKTVLIIQPRDITNELTGNGDKGYLEELECRVEIFDTVSSTEPGFANLHTDGQTKETAYILEGYINREDKDISHYSPLEVASYIATYWGEKVGMENPTITDFNFGGNTSGAADGKYGTWTLEISSDPVNGVQPSPTYVKIMFDDINNEPTDVLNGFFHVDLSVPVIPEEEDGTLPTIVIPPTYSDLVDNATSGLEGFTATTSGNNVDLDFSTLNVEGMTSQDDINAAWRDLYADYIAALVDELQDEYGSGYEVVADDDLITISRDGYQDLTIIVGYDPSTIPTYNQAATGSGAPMLAKIWAIKDTITFGNVEVDLSDSTSAATPTEDGFVVTLYGSVIGEVGTVDCDDAAEELILLAIQAAYGVTDSGDTYTETTDAGGVAYAVTWGAINSVDGAVTTAVTLKDADENVITTTFSIIVREGAGLPATTFVVTDTTDNGSQDAAPGTDGQGTQTATEVDMTETALPDAEVAIEVDGNDDDGYYVNVVGCIDEEDLPTDIAEKSDDDATEAIATIVLFKAIEDCYGKNGDTYGDYTVSYDDTAVEEGLGKSISGLFNVKVTLTAADNSTITVVFGITIGSTDDDVGSEFTVLIEGETEFLSYWNWYLGAEYDGTGNIGNPFVVTGSVVPDVAYADDETTYGIPEADNDTQDIDVAYSAVLKAAMVKNTDTTASKYTITKVTEGGTVADADPNAEWVFKVLFESTDDDDAEYYSVAFSNIESLSENATVYVGKTDNQGLFDSLEEANGYFKISAKIDGTSATDALLGDFDEAFLPYMTSETTVEEYMNFNSGEIPGTTNKFGYEEGFGGKALDAYETVNDAMVVVIKGTATNGTVNTGDATDATGGGIATGYNVFTGTDFRALTIESLKDTTVIFGVQHVEVTTVTGNDFYNYVVADDTTTSTGAFKDLTFKHGTNGVMTSDGEATVYFIGADTDVADLSVSFDLIEVEASAANAYLCFYDATLDTTTTPSIANKTANLLAVSAVGDSTGNVTDGRLTIAKSGDTYDGVVTLTLPLSKEDPDENGRYDTYKLGIDTNGLDKAVYTLKIDGVDYTDEYTTAGSDNLYSYLATMDTSLDDGKYVIVMDDDGEVLAYEAANSWGTLTGAVATTKLTQNLSVYTNAIGLDVSLSGGLSYVSDDGQIDGALSGYKTNGSDVTVEVYGVAEDVSTLFFVNANDAANLVIDLKFSHADMRAPTTSYAGWAGKSVTISGTSLTESKFGIYANFDDANLLDISAVGSFSLDLGKEYGDLTGDNKAKYTGEVLNSIAVYVSTTDTKAIKVTAGTTSAE